MAMSRRRFLGGAAVAHQIAAYSSNSARRYHLCVSPDALDANPGLPELVRAAGVTNVWIAGYLYGHWYYTSQRIQAAMRAFAKSGLDAQVVNVPLGHPGDSLGAVSGQPPLIPPPHWQPCTAPDGKQRWGTSLHPPATAENVQALKRLAGIGVKRVFLDDDFRLAAGPGAIGGCFCDTHIDEFRRLHGYSASIKEQLVESAKARELSPALRAWIDYHCDQLSACFRTLQQSASGIQLGIMVMWMGSEKAGIRLTDYAGVPLRVGELMFDDRSFAPVAAKTDELFSSLFHRRFVAPQLAFSETTAYPANRLSAPNMAAKLAVSTLSDVRNTMFMSGLTAFPATHWQTLAPAMRHHAAIHNRIAGHHPRGPFKHWWSEHSRYVSADRPDSLFLASGVPFEVAEQAPPGEFVFGDSPRPPESLPDLFRLKRKLIPQLRDTPFVDEDKPVVCSWLPSAKTVLLWNLAETHEQVHVRYGDRDRRIAIEPLGLAEVRF